MTDKSGYPYIYQPSVSLVETEDGPRIADMFWGENQILTLLRKPGTPEITFGKTQFLADGTGYDIVATASFDWVESLDAVIHLEPVLLRVEAIRALKNSGPGEEALRALYQEAARQFVAEMDTVEPDVRFALEPELPPRLSPDAATAAGESENREGESAGAGLGIPLDAETLDALAMRAQLEALSQGGPSDSLFEIRSIGPDGHVTRRTGTVEELTGQFTDLARLNAAGHDIYVRPAPANNGLIAIDDIDEAGAHILRQAGIPVVALLETSPGNRQAWLRISDGPLDPFLEAAAQRLATSLAGGDEKAVGHSRIARLAGFANNKPGRRRRDGTAPMVLLDGTGPFRPGPGLESFMTEARSLADALHKASLLEDRVPAAQDTHRDVARLPGISGNPGAAVDPLHVEGIWAAHSLALSRLPGGNIAGGKRRPVRVVTRHPAGYSAGHPNEPHAESDGKDLIIDHSRFDTSKIDWRLALHVAGRYRAAGADTGTIARQVEAWLRMAPAVADRRRGRLNQYIERTARRAVAVQGADIPALISRKSAALRLQDAGTGKAEASTRGEAARFSLGAEEFEPSRDRRIGVLEALNAAGIAVDPRLTAEGKRHYVLRIGDRIAGTVSSFGKLEDLAYRAPARAVSRPVQLQGQLAGTARFSLEEREDSTFHLPWSMQAAFSQTRLERLREELLRRGATELGITRLGIVLPGIPASMTIEGTGGARARLSVAAELAEGGYLSYRYGFETEADRRPDFNRLEALLTGLIGGQWDTSISALSPKSFALGDAEADRSAGLLPDSHIDLPTDFPEWARALLLDGSGEASRAEAAGMTAGNTDRISDEIAIAAFVATAAALRLVRDREQPVSDALEQAAELYFGTESMTAARHAIGRDIADVLQTLREGGSLPPPPRGLRLGSVTVAALDEAGRRLLDMLAKPAPRPSGHPGASGAETGAEEPAIEGGSLPARRDIVSHLLALPGARALDEAVSGFERIMPLLQPRPDMSYAVDMPESRTAWRRETSLVAGDVIRFSEAVFTGRWPRGRYAGTRQVEARIERESYGDQKQQHSFTLTVLASQGEDPLRHGDTIIRKGRTLYRDGVERLPWADERLRTAALEEKQRRGEAARAARTARRENGPSFSLQPGDGPDQNIPPSLTGDMIMTNANNIIVTDLTRLAGEESRMGVLVYPRQDRKRIDDVVPVAAPHDPAAHASDPLTPKIDTAEVARAIRDLRARHGAHPVQLNTPERYLDMAALIQELGDDHGVSREKFSPAPRQAGMDAETTRTESSGDLTDNSPEAFDPERDFRFEQGEIVPIAGGELTIIENSHPEYYIRDSRDGGLRQNSGYTVRTLADLAEAPPLTGSDKQIDWASQLRWYRIHEINKTLHGLVPGIREVMAGDSAEKDVLPAQIAAILDAKRALIRNATSASYWIVNRTKPVKGWMHEAVQGIDAEQTSSEASPAGQDKEQAGPSRDGPSYALSDMSPPATAPDSAPEPGTSGVEPWLLDAIQAKLDYREYPGADSAGAPGPDVIEYLADHLMGVALPRGQALILGAGTPQVAGTAPEPQLLLVDFENRRILADLGAANIVPSLEDAASVLGMDPPGTGTYTSLSAASFDRLMVSLYDRDMGETVWSQVRDRVLERSPAVFRAAGVAGVSPGDSRLPLADILDPKSAWQWLKENRLQAAGISAASAGAAALAGALTHQEEVQGAASSLIGLLRGGNDSLDLSAEPVDQAGYGMVSGQASLAWEEAERLTGLALAEQDAQALASSTASIDPDMARISAEVQILDFNADYEALLDELMGPLPSDPAYREVTEFLRGASDMMSIASDRLTSIMSSGHAWLREMLGDALANGTVDSVGQAAAPFFSIAPLPDSAGASREDQDQHPVRSAAPLPLRTERLKALMIAGSAVDRQDYQVSIDGRTGDIAVAFSLPMAAADGTAREPENGGGRVTPISLLVSADGRAAILDGMKKRYSEIGGGAFAGLKSVADLLGHSLRESHRGLVKAVTVSAPSRDGEMLAAYLGPRQRAAALAPGGLEKLEHRFKRSLLRESQKAGIAAPDLMKVAITLSRSLEANEAAALRTIVSQDGLGEKASLLAIGGTDSFVGAYRSGAEAEAALQLLTETVSRNTAPQNTAPQNTAPQNTAPQNTAPQAGQDDVAADLAFAVPVSGQQAARLEEALRREGYEVTRTPLSLAGERQAALDLRTGAAVATGIAALGAGGLLVAQGSGDRLETALEHIGQESAAFAATLSEIAAKAAKGHVERAGEGLKLLGDWASQHLEDSPGLKESFDFIQRSIETVPDNLDSLLLDRDGPIAPLYRAIDGLQQIQLQEALRSLGTIEIGPGFSTLTDRLVDRASDVMVEAAGALQATGDAAQNILNIPAFSVAQSPEDRRAPHPAASVAAAAPTAREAAPAPAKSPPVSSPRKGEKGTLPIIVDADSPEKQQQAKDLLKKLSPEQLNRHAIATQIALQDLPKCGQRSNRDILLARSLDTGARLIRDEELARGLSVSSIPAPKPAQQQRRSHQLER